MRRKIDPKQERLLVRVILVPLNGRGHSSNKACTLEGSPAACFQQLEWQTLQLFPQYACGFSLLLGSSADTSVWLTPSRLYEAVLWESSCLTVWVQSAGSSRRTRKCFTHGRWIHGAAVKIQKSWQAYWRARQRVEELNVLHAFMWKLRTHSLRCWNPEPLLQDQCGEEAIPEEDLILLRLAVAWATCESCRKPSAFGARVFHWARSQAAAYCVRLAEEFREELGGLAEHPASLKALKRLTQCFLTRLSPAFPWFTDGAASSCIEGAAESAACANYVSNPVMTSADARALRIYSAVLGAVLESIEDVLCGIWRSFENAKLLAEIQELSCKSAVEVFVSRLKLPESLPALRLKLSETEPVVPPPLLLAYERDENFGRAIRTACAFFGLKSARLSTSQESFILPECLFGSLGTPGMSCTIVTLLLTPYEPDPSSFDYALFDIVKALGSSFSLDRQSKVLRLSLVDQILLEGQDHVGVANIVMLPEDYSSETQYYHFYNSVARKFTSARCDLTTFVAWVQVLNNRSEVVAGDGIVATWEPTILMEELEDLQSKIRRWERARSPCWRGPQAYGDSKRHCGFMPGCVSGSRNSWADLDISPLLALAGWDSDDADKYANGIDARREDENTDETANRNSRGNLLGNSVFMLDSVGRTLGDIAKLRYTPAEEGQFGDNPQCSTTTAQAYSDFLGGAQRPTHSNVSSSCSDGQSFSESAGKHVTAGATILNVTHCSSSCSPGQSNYESAGEEATVGRRSAEDEPEAAVTTSGTVARFVNSPEVVTTTMMAAAASSLPLFSQTTSTLVLQQLQGAAVYNDNLSHILPDLVSNAGAFGSSALAGALGPMGASIFSQWGEVQTRAATQSAQLAQKQVAHANLTAEGMIVAAAFGVSIKAAGNLASYSRGEISKRDVVKQVFRDGRDGAAVWGCCQLVMMGLKAGSVGPPGALKNLCVAALAHPSPTMFVALGMWWLSLRSMQEACGCIDHEQFQADAILSGSASCAGVTASILGTFAGLSPLSCSIMTLVTSNFFGLYSYEAWRIAQQAHTQHMMHSIAREIFGLPPGFTREQLRQRWRVLARYSHPDRNHREDAKQAFTLFSICRQVLLVPTVIESWSSECWQYLWERLNEIAQSRWQRVATETPPQGPAQERSSLVSISLMGQEQFSQAASSSSTRPRREQAASSSSTGPIREQAPSSSSIRPPREQAASSSSIRPPRELAPSSSSTRPLGERAQKHAKAQEPPCRASRNLTSSMYVT